jgi:hypothetical protein
MAAPTTDLGQLPVGSIVLFGARLEERDPTTGLRFRLFTRDRIARAQLQIAPDLSITGSFLFPPSQVPVDPTTVPFAVGDVVINDQTSETLVVREVWSTVEQYGFLWSNTLKRRPVYTPDGWTKAGTMTFT